MSQESYRKLISCQRCDAAAAVLRFFLRIPAAVYSFVMRSRNFLYSKSLLKTNRVNALIFSIGNITVGGTGKTPLVIWLCKLLQEKGIRCAILTRGYKTRTQKRATSNEQRRTRTDEPAMLSQSCPQARVVVNPDRVAGATEAVSEFGAEVLIMDDGFQHRRLARDLDIVTIDATRPFGYGRLLPAGLLREPVTALARADAVVITRCDQADEDELIALERKLRQLNPNMTIARSIHVPLAAKTADSKEISLKQLRGKEIFAFCGIGNPEAFLSTVKSLGCQIAGSKVYNDHHHYTAHDVAGIYEQAMRLKAKLILTTQKDWTKIVGLGALTADMPFAYLAIELEFISGQDQLRGLIENALAGKIPTNRKGHT